VLSDDNGLSPKMKRTMKWRRKKMKTKTKTKLLVPGDEVAATVHEGIPEDELEGEAVFAADEASDI
jgi:hypothetical protein